MVAGSSLRRHPRASDPGKHINHSDDSSQSSLRSKRIRSNTLLDQEQDRKRRKLARNRPQPLQIPLRSRTAQPQPANGTQTATPPLSIDSPTPTDKPQYDQIRIIEARARKAIQTTDYHRSAQDDRRKLRSEHGGSRSKSELAQYFPNFEEMLSLEPSDPNTLTPKTKVFLVDDTPNYKPPLPRSDPFGFNKPLHNTRIIDLPLNKYAKKLLESDPMGQEAYLKIHRKAERHEKQMKNGDRERAQHEKYQLEKLLEDLRGPDWLKTLGISGITETEKKRYEPKRVLFIRETQALIDKFRWWKEEEKRRKVERDQALQEEAAETEAAVEDEEVAKTSRSASTQPPNSSEIDALASQQLLDEAQSATNKRKKVAELPFLPPPLIHKPFVSFFAKKHLRDAAVSGRQRGRTMLAFGQPVPEMAEADFGLPPTILTEEAIRASQRSRRRRRRGPDE